MCWTDRAARLLRLAAALAAAAQIAGCADPAGEHEIVAVFGRSLDANLATQAARAGAGGALSRDFAASAEPTVTFAFDDAALDGKAREILDGQARWLREHPDVHMTITGHADLVGPERYNHGLGLRRARSARDHLVAQGIAPDRLDAIESRGEQDPVVPTEARERRNRRAVTTVGSAAGGTGAGLDGNYAARLYDGYQSGRVGATEAEPIAVN